jgi:DNA polymerase III gamma/tau subunit
MSNESTINFVFVSRLNDGAAEIRIETNSRTALQDALVHLGLASTASFGAAILGAPVNEATQAPAAEPVAEPVAEVKPKKSRAAKVAEEAVAAPVEEAAQTPEPEAEVQAPAVEAAAEVAAPVAAAAKATVEEAAAAVRAYGAKHGLDAARALLQKHGFARTTEVTAEKAGDIVAEAAL